MFKVYFCYPAIHLSNQDTNNLLLSSVVCNSYFTLAVFCCICWTHLEGVSDNVGTPISWVNNIDLLQGENAKMNTCVKVNQSLGTERRGKVTGTNMGKSKKWEKISSWLDTWNDRRVKGHKKADNLSLLWVFNALTSSYITWADWRKKLLKVTVCRSAPVIFISFIICIIFYHFSYAK